MYTGAKGEQQGHRQLPSRAEETHRKGPQGRMRCKTHRGLVYCIKFYYLKIGSHHIALARNSLCPLIYGNYPALASEVPGLQGCTTTLGTVIAVIALKSFIPSNQV